MHVLAKKQSLRHCTRCSFSSLFGIVAAVPGKKGDSLPGQTLYAQTSGPQQYLVVYADIKMKFALERFQEELGGLIVILAKTSTIPS